MNNEVVVQQGSMPQAAPQARSILVDVVRGLAIALVVMGHSAQGVARRGWWGPGPFGDQVWIYIYEFHMPAFFFVSGIFIESSVAKRGPLQFVKTKVSQMMYPYLLWSVLIYLAAFPLQRFIHVPPLTPRVFLFDLLDGSTLWFLPAIFLCVVLGMLFRNVSKPVLFALAVVVALLPVKWHINFVSETLHHFPYLVAGMWIARRIEQIERIPLAFAAPGVALLAAIVYGFSSRPWPHNPALDFVAGFIGTAMLFLLARCFRKGSAARVMAWVGEASFGVYLLSAYGQGAGRELLLRGLHTTQPVAQLLVQTIVGVAVSAWIYQRRVKLRLNWAFMWPF